MGGGAGIELVATGSDDGTVKIWEGGYEASKQAIATFELGCPVTAVCWSADGSNLYIGALDNEIHVCAFQLIPLNTTLIEEPSRFTISASKQKYQPYQVTRTPQLQLHSPPMGPSSSPPHSRHKPSSTMSDHSLHPRHVYIGYLGVPPQVSRTHYSREPGAKTTVDNASLLEVLTGRLPFGMSKVQRFCTRFGLKHSHLVKILISTSQLPGHRGTVTSVDFHPKEPVSESAVSSHRFSSADMWFVSPHWWKGWYHACWRTRTGRFCLNNASCLGRVNQETLMFYLHWVHFGHEATRKKLCRPQTPEFRQDRNLG